MLLRRTILGSCVVLAVAFGSPAFSQTKTEIDQAKIASFITRFAAEKTIVCKRSHNPVDCNKQYDAIIEDLRALAAAGLRLDEARREKDVAKERAALLGIIQIADRYQTHSDRLRAEYVDPHFKGTRPISLVQ